MEILRDYTFSWQQMVVFKVSLLTIGIAIGAYWQALFLPYAGLLAIVGVVLGLYLAFISLK